MGSKADSLGRGAGGDTPEAPFRPLSKPYLTGFKSCDVDPPSVVFLGLTDKLWVRICPLVFGAKVLLNGRLLRADGTVVGIKEVVPIANAGQATDFLFDVAEGFLLDLSIVNNNGGNPALGSVYAIAGIARGNAGGFDIVATLMAGQLTQAAPLSWPFSVPVRPTDGQGFVRSVQVGNPAAGAEWSFSVPNFSRARVRSVFFTLQTAAAVATRIVTLVVDDGANIVGQFAANVTQIASLTETYTASAAPFVTTSLGTSEYIPLPPDLLLEQGFRIRTVTTAIQGADQYSTISLLIEQWTEN